MRQLAGPGYRHGPTEPFVRRVAHASSGFGTREASRGFGEERDSRGPRHGSRRRARRPLWTSASRRAEQRAPTGSGSPCTESAPARPRDAHPGRGIPHERLGAVGVEQVGSQRVLKSELAPYRFNSGANSIPRHARPPSCLEHERLGEADEGNRRLVALSRHRRHQRPGWRAVGGLQAVIPRKPRS